MALSVPSTPSADRHVFPATSSIPRQMPYGRRGPILSKSSRDRYLLESLGIQHATKAYSLGVVSDDDDGKSAEVGVIEDGFDTRPHEAMVATSVGSERFSSGGNGSSSGIHDLTRISLQGTIENEDDDKNVEVGVIEDTFDIKPHEATKSFSGGGDGSEYQQLLEKYERLEQQLRVKDKLVEDLRGCNNFGDQIYTMENSCFTKSPSRDADSVLIQRLQSQLLREVISNSKLEESFERKNDECLQSLQRENDLLEALLVSREQALGVNTSVNSVSGIDIDLSSSQISELNKDINIDDKGNDEVTLLKSQLEELRQRLADKEAAIIGLQSVHDARGVEIEAHRKDLAKKSTAIDDAQRELEQYKKELDKKSQESAHLSTAFDAFKKKTSQEFSISRLEIKRNEDVIERLEKNVQQIMEELSSSKVIIADLEAAAKVSCGELSEKQKSIEDNERAMKLQTSELEQTKEQVNKLAEEVRSYEIRYKENEHQTHNSEETTKQSQVASLQEELTLANEKVANLESEIVDLKKSCDQQKSDAKVALSKFKKESGNKAELKSMKLELTAKGKELIDLQSTIEKAELDKKRLDKTLKSSGQEVKKCLIEIDRLQKNADKDWSEISRLKSTVTTQHDEIVALNNEAADMRRRMEELMATKLKQNETIRRLHEEMSGKEKELTMEVARLQEDGEMLRSDMYSQLQRHQEKLAQVVKEKEAVMANVNDVGNKNLGNEELSQIKKDLEVANKELLSERDNSGVLHHQLRELSEKLDLQTVELGFMEKLRIAIKEKETELAAANVTIEEMVREKDMMRESSNNSPVEKNTRDVEAYNDGDVDILRIDIEALNQVVRDRENDLLIATNDVERLTTDNNKLKKELEELQKELQTQKNNQKTTMSPTVQAAKNDNMNMMNTIKQTKLLLQRDEELSEAQNQLSQKNDEISTLIKKVDALNTDLETAKKEQHKLKVSLLAKEKELIECKNNLQGSHDDIIVSENQYHSESLSSSGGKTESSDSAHNKDDNMKPASPSPTRVTNSVSINVDDDKDEDIASSESIAQLKKENEELRTTIDKWTSEVASSRGLNCFLEEMLENSQKECKAVKSSLKEREKLIDDMNLELATLRATTQVDKEQYQLAQAFPNTTPQNSNKEGIVSADNKQKYIEKEMKRKLNALRAECSVLTSQLIQTRQRIENLEEELTATKMELERSKHKQLVETKPRVRLTVSSPSSGQMTPPSFRDGHVAGSPSARKELESTRATLIQLEAKVQAYEERLRKYDLENSQSSITLDSDVVQNKLAEEIEANTELKSQINELEGLCKIGQIEKQQLLLQLSEQTSKVASLEELVSNSKFSIDALEKSSKKFEEKIKRMNSFSEREQIFLKTVMNESREILDAIECALETECVSMNTFIVQLQDSPDSDGDNGKTKFDQLVNEIMTLLNTLSVMVVNLEASSNHIEKQILSADSIPSPPISPIANANRDAALTDKDAIGNTEIAN